MDGGERKTPRSTSQSPAAFPCSFSLSGSSWGKEHRARGAGGTGLFQELPTSFKSSLVPRVCPQPVSLLTSCRQAAIVTMTSAGLYLGVTRQRGLKKERSRSNRGARGQVNPSNTVSLPQGSGNGGARSPSREPGSHGLHPFRTGPEAHPQHPLKGIPRAGRGLLLDTPFKAPLTFVGFNSH